jgi:hypothetical protein
MVTDAAPQTQSKPSLFHRLKLIGAILVITGLLLPLYSCSGRFLDSTGREVHYVNQAGAIVPDKDVDPHQPLPSGVVKLEPNSPRPAGVTFHKNYHFFFGEFSYDDVFDWLRLFGFLWPLAAVIWVKQLEQGRKHTVFRWVEPLLVLESSFALCTSAIFGAKEIGFWSAWSGVILYSLGAAGIDVRALAAWKPAMSRPWKRVNNVLIYTVFLGCSVLSVFIFFKWLVA